MRDQLLERSRTVKCLGVFLVVRLMWNDHIEYVRKICFVGLGKLKGWGGVLLSSTKKQSIMPWCYIYPTSSTDRLFGKNVHSV